MPRSSCSILLRGVLCSGTSPAHVSFVRGARFRRDEADELLSLVSPSGTRQNEKKGVPNMADEKNDAKNESSPPRSSTSVVLTSTSRSARSSPRRPATSSTPVSLLPSLRRGRASRRTARSTTHTCRIPSSAGKLHQATIAQKNCTKQRTDGALCNSRVSRF